MSELNKKSRSEHLQWCKDRAMEYVHVGDMQEAVTSMMADLGKHPETAGHSAIQLGTMLMLSGQLSSPYAVTKFIKGFN